jgi:hypothetical protein
LLKERRMMDEQDLLGLLVGAWLAVLVAMVLVCLHGFVGSSTGDELVAEAGLVVALDLQEESVMSEVDGKRESVRPVGRPVPDRSLR